MRKIIFLLLLSMVCSLSYSQLTLKDVSKAISAGRTPTKTKNKTAAPTGKKALVINDITFANVDNNGTIIDDFGTDLYASEIKYLKPLIHYTGLAASGTQIELYAKLYTDDGSLKSTESSPNGYTYSTKVNLAQGEDQTLLMSGWGSNAGGVYSAGAYRYEVWYNGKKIFQQNLRLYSGSTPIVQSKLVSINSVLFGNKDADGNVVHQHGATLYEGETMYVSAKLNCKGLYSSKQQATLYYRYYYPNGNMMSGSDSPRSFTSKAMLEINPGKNSITLGGYGSRDVTVYKAGIYKVEFWIDGAKVYETSFEVKKKSAASGTSVSVSSAPSSSAALLSDLLNYPMRNRSIELDNDSPRKVYTKLKSNYKVDNSSKDGNSSYYIWKSKNADMYSMAYLEMPPYYFYYNNSNSHKAYINKRIKYVWEMDKSVDVYAKLDQIVRDFRTLGIDLDYEKTNETYTKAKGEIKIDKKKYEIECTDYSSVFQIAVEVWYYN